MQLKV